MKLNLFKKIFKKSEQKNIFLFIFWKIQKPFIFLFILFFFLFIVFYPPRFFSRLFLNFFIIVFLEPQTPEWNPLIPKLRSTDLFFDYKEAKWTLHRITWGTIIIFYFFHFRY